MFPLAFVAGWLQGHWWGFISRNYVVWPTFLLMNVFIALKGSHFWFLFEINKPLPWQLVYRKADEHAAPEGFERLWTFCHRNGYIYLLRRRSNNVSVQPRRTAAASSRLFCYWGDLSVPAWSDTTQTQKMQINPNLLDDRSHWLALAALIYYFFISFSISMTDQSCFFMNTYSIHFDWFTVVNHMNINPRPFLCRGLSQRQDIENYIQSAIFCHC